MKIIMFTILHYTKLLFPSKIGAFRPPPNFQQSSPTLYVILKKKISQMGSQEIPSFDLSEYQTINLKVMDLNMNFAYFRQLWATPFLMSP